MKTNEVRNHLFIVNVRSGKGNAKQYLPLLKELEQKRRDVFVETTETIEELREILFSYASVRIARIYAVGGDGTLSCLVSELIRGGNVCSEVAVLPGGTGNDYIRNLMPRSFFEKSPEKQIEAVMKARVKKIDIGRINEGYFVNIASVGLDADVIEKSLGFKNNKILPPKLAYAFSAIYTVLFRKQKKTARVYLDGQKLEGDYLLIAIGNGKFYGGGIKVLPEAELSNGSYSIVKVDEVSNWQILHLAKPFVEGRHGGIKEIQTLAGRHLRFVADTKFCVQYDGELLVSEEVEMELLPSAIEVAFLEEEQCEIS